MPPDRAEPCVFDSPAPSLYPPVAPWRVYLLMFVSWGLYSTVLSYRLSKDLQLLGTNSRRPILSAIAQIVPIWNFLEFFRISECVDTTAARQGRRLPTTPMGLTSLLVVIAIASHRLPDTLFPIGLALWPLPWLVLHRQMDRIRCTAASARPAPRDGFSLRQRTLLFGGVAFTALVFAGMRPEYARLVGEPLPPGATIVGASANYYLRAPDHSWTQVKPGTVEKDTDLELMGPNSKQWALVRVLRGPNLSLDEVVDFRRQQAENSMADLAITEQRQLLPESDLVPLSLTRYAGLEPPFGKPVVVLVATAQMPDTTIEVVTHAPAGGESALRALLQSLRIRPSDRVQP